MKELTREEQIEQCERIIDNDGCTGSSISDLVCSICLFREVDCGMVVKLAKAKLKELESDTNIKAEIKEESLNELYEKINNVSNDVQRLKGIIHDRKYWFDKKKKEKQEKTVYNKYHHITIVVDNGKTKTYIDGVEKTLKDLINEIS